MTDARLQFTDDSAPPQAAAGLPCPSIKEIDASCRWPGLLLLLAALGWLLLAAALATATALRLLLPGVLTEWGGVVYGRLWPATTTVFLYGFASQGCFALGLWITARLSQACLPFRGLALACALIWNGALGLGVLGILNGNATGNPWLELPREAALPLMIAAFGLTGLAFHTAAQRASRAPGVDQWSLLTGMAVFPGLLLMAQLLAAASPMRGVLQAVAETWFGQNLRVFWIDFMGLGVLLYLMPQLTREPLPSRSLAWFSFWTLGVFGALGGMHRHFGGPFPAWMPSLGVVATVLTLLPLLSLRLVFRIGLWRQKSRLSDRAAHHALRRALLFFFVGGFLEIANSFARVRQITQFTPVQTGLEALSVAGFATAALLASLLPAVSSFVNDDCETVVSRWTLRWLFGGLLLTSVALIAGGIVQGLAFDDPHQEFAAAAAQLRPFLWLAAGGCLLSFLGTAALIRSLAVRLGQVFRQRHLPRWRQFCGTATTRAEVRS